MKVINNLKNYSWNEKNSAQIIKKPYKMQLRNREDLFEAQKEFLKNNSSYAEKCLNKAKQRLLKNEKLTEQELEKICQIQIELLEMEKQQEQKTKAFIEVNRK